MNDQPPQPDDAQLAALCSRWMGRPIAVSEPRIHSIEWVSNGEEWKATVGERLRGVRIRERTRKGKRVEVRTPIADAATVLAIFAGSPYLVVTNAPPVGNSTSEWNNPFMVGAPFDVAYFT